MRRLFTILLLLFLSSAFALGQDDDYREIDSLKNLYFSLDVNDTTRPYVWNKITSMQFNLDSIIKYAEIEIDVAKRFGNAKIESSAYADLKWSYISKNDPISALKYAYKNTSLGDSLQDKAILAEGYRHVGECYTAMGNGTKGFDNYKKALEYATANNDDETRAKILNNMGECCYTQGLHSDAEKYYTQAMRIDSALQNETQLMYVIERLAATKITQYCTNKFFKRNTKLLTEAEELFKKGLEMGEKAEDDYIITFCSIGILQSALEQAEISPSNKQNLARIKGLIDSAKIMVSKSESDIQDFNIKVLESQYLNLCNNKQGALSILDSINAQFSSDQESYTLFLDDLYNYYENIHTKSRDWEKAYIYTKMRDTLNSKFKLVDLAVNSTQELAESEYNEKIKLREIEEAKRETKSRIVLNSVLIILAIVTGLGIYIVVLMNRTRKKNIILNLQKEEISSQKEEIEVQRENLEEQNIMISQQNASIKASITYASLIQKAALPTSKLMDEIFSENMVMYRPRDIVAGDFYWASKIGSLKLLAVADCTGHGVPGAFVSMLGISILNEISSTVAHDRNAGLILDMMRDKLKVALHQTGRIDDNHDGIDMAFVIIDDENGELHYAGAYRPLIMIRQGKLTKINADKMPIGWFIKETNFSEKIIKTEPGDKFFMYSDGITDQFGFDETGSLKKFGHQKLCNNLERNAMLPMQEIKKSLEAELDSWKSSEQQLDDNIIVGITI